MRNSSENYLPGGFLRTFCKNRVFVLVALLLAIATEFAQAQTACYTAWASGSVYTAGNLVSRSGNNYTAKWWTQGEDPVTASCTDCVWRLEGPCGSTGTNTAPTVGLTAPANGASYTAPASITISANATDNVSVAKVDFYNGTTLLNSDTAAPYTYSWTGVAVGTYSITAKATDNAGLTTTSAAVSVTVSAAPTGQAVPGTIEAESFTTQFGTQNETTTDTGGGLNVGYIDAADYLDYAVNVATAGSYTVGFRVASLNGGATLQLRNSAGTVLGAVNVGATGGWQTWQTLTTTATLPAGAQTLRVYAAAGGVNINWISFAGGTPPTNTPPTVSLTSPANGATATAPATITISANAADADGTVSSVAFYNGATLLNTDTTAPYSYSWTGVAVGTYSITAKATDNAGAVTTSSAVSVTVSTTPPANTPPTVSLTSPANGSTATAPASITISANATDNVSVAKVDFYNGTTLLFSDATAPYSYTWTGVAAGSYTIKATATDNAGLTASATSSITVNGTTPVTGLPKHIMSGYYHTWNGGVPFIKLRDVNAGWDVINISFAEPVAAGSTDGRMKFVVAGVTADYTITDFKTDIKTLQGRGKKIVLSIGGYEGFFSLTTPTAATQFANDIKAIVTEYGFDGIDIDLEQSSVQFNSGADPDFKNPTSPKIVNLISGIRQVLAAYPATFILSWAPETFYFQMGHQYYGGTNANVDARSGDYVPLVHALRDRTTYVQAQLYNSAQMQGNDGVMYTMGTVDGVAAMTEMVIQGFTVGSATGPLFPGLRPDQVVIGVPASQGAAGSGQISNADLQAAFSRVNNKYPGLRGIMSWSINWDAYQNANSFVTSNSAYLKGLANRGALASSSASSASSTKAGLSVYPNPVLGGSRLSLDLGARFQTVRVVLTDLAGRQVATYSFANVRTADLAIPARSKGMYLLRVVADGTTFTQKVVAE